MRFTQRLIEAEVRSSTPLKQGRHCAHKQQQWLLGNYFRDWSIASQVLRLSKQIGHRTRGHDRPARQRQRGLVGDAERGT
jgi:hypothetical protein